MARGTKAKVEEEAPRVPFRGFGSGAGAFFDALAADNSRDFFTAHKETFETQVREPMGALVEALAFAFAAHDIPLTGTAKGSVFRLNRDVRFSKDKSPYKTHCGAVLTRDGTKKSQGLFYIHLGGTGGSFCAMGFYGPEPDDLHALRKRLVAKPEVWQKAARGLTKAGLELMREDALVRMPKGFEQHAGSDVADLLRLRHLVVRKPIPDARLGSPDLVRDLLDTARAGLPLLEFGWAAVG